MNICTFIEILKGLLTPLIAVIALWIAYQQRVINKNKLKLDLFEKRYEVYKYVRVFIANTISHGNVTDDELNDFRRNTMKNIFLFKEDISQYIEEIDSKARELQKFEKQLENAGTDDIINKRMEVFNWFPSQFESSKNIFSNYLRIDDK